jgi:1-aminocyclopropane-1-carboxylate deaminase/D-cysteine desulfhydrase-like pyridoxal-dependent ACC family enzyme
VSDLWPLFDRFPRLAGIPHVSLRRAPTPVVQAGENLWIKRDDLTADPIGGNKVRALEFLLAPFAKGSQVITGGSRGSTHVLATMIHGRALDLDVAAASWPQEMNEVAQVVDARIDREMKRRHFRNPVSAALWLTWQSWRGRQVVPAGGTSPVGVLGQVNAGLELSDQVKAGLLPEPELVVVPLGTGGTVAGLALGLALGGLRSKVVGARVVPRIIANRSRIRRLIRATLRQIGSSVEPSFEIAEGVYGGAYGRALAGAPGATSTGLPLDPTYSAKAFVTAMKSARDARTLFWLTFDSRWMNA